MGEFFLKKSASKALPIQKKVLNFATAKQKMMAP